MKANAFIADELENKVVHLSKALDSASKIIEQLEIENENLKAILSVLDSHDDKQSNPEF